MYLGLYGLRADSGRGRSASEVDAPSRRRKTNRAQPASSSKTRPNC